MEGDYSLLMLTYPLSLLAATSNYPERRKVGAPRLEGQDWGIIGEISNEVDSYLYGTFSFLMGRDFILCFSATFLAMVPNSLNKSTDVEDDASGGGWRREHRKLNFSRDFGHVWNNSNCGNSAHCSNNHSSGGVRSSSSVFTETKPVRIWYCVQFRRLCQICLAMPLIGLVSCFLIAVLFQFGDIQETACKVS